MLSFIIKSVFFLHKCTDKTYKQINQMPDFYLNMILLKKYVWIIKKLSFFSPQSVHLEILLKAHTFELRLFSKLVKISNQRHVHHNLKAFLELY